MIGVSRFFVHTQHQSMVGWGPAHPASQRTRCSDISVATTKECSGAFPLFAKTTQTRVTLSSSLTLVDMICDMVYWRLALANHAAVLGLGHVVLGHVCASQSDIPWPEPVRWVARWSCEARLRPDRANVGNNSQAGPQNLIATRKLDSNSKVYVAVESASDRLLSITRHAWLMLVLQLYSLTQ